MVSPSATATGPGAQHFWLTLLKVVLAAGLLSLLFNQVPWRDSVTLTSASGDIMKLEVTPTGSDAAGGLVLAGQGEGTGWAFTVSGEDGTTLADIRPSAAFFEQRLPDPAIWAEATGSYRPGLADQLAKLTAGPFLLASLLALGWTLAMALRWRVLLAAVGLRLPFARVLQVNLAGLAASQVMLGSVGGDLVRAAAVARDGHVPATLEARTRAVLAMAMDRLVGLVALLALGTAAALAFTVTHADLGQAFALALGVLAAALAALLLFARRGTGEESVNPNTSRLRQIFASTGQALASYRTRIPTLIAAFLLSLISHSFLILAGAQIGAALGLGVALAGYFQIVPISETLQALPISPAGWGVGEAVYTVLFKEAGETAALALSFALGARAVRLGQALLGIPCLPGLLRSSRNSGQSQEAR
ncbi:MAG TPA: lysylphosphatidylglycerol synthase transmembrane domain-containing protein [Planctomycetota bacterium]|nr:lysylphosphatidylglycerol synthase transmembrane domain-containing protein [Planctomycetota bacterium]